MHTAHLLFALGLLAATTTAAAIETPSEAERLYENNCISCHDSKVFTRPDHHIGNRGALKRQVRRCELNLGLRWFDDQIDAVSHFLNSRYYKFPE